MSEITGDTQQAATTDNDMFNTFLSAIREEKAALRVDRPNNLGCSDTHNFGSETTAKIAERIASLKTQNDRLATALEGLLTRHARLVESGDCGFWDVDQEPEVIEARAALDALPDAEGEAPRD